MAFLLHTLRYISRLIYCFHHHRSQGLWCFHLLLHLHKSSRLRYMFLIQSLKTAYSSMSIRFLFHCRQIMSVFVPKDISLDQYLPAHHRGEVGYHHSRYFHLLISILLNYTGNYYYSHHYYFDFHHHMLLRNYLE